MDDSEVGRPASAAFDSGSTRLVRPTIGEVDAMPEETAAGPVTVPIDRYTVLLGAFSSRDPGRAPSQNTQIFLSPPPDHEIRTILVFFKVDAPPRLGWIGPTGNALTVFLPPDTFANFYSILQTEKPIFVQYELREDHNLESFHLTSSGEPVGEGPINHSGERETG